MGERVCGERGGDGVAVETGAAFKRLEVIDVVRAERSLETLFRSRRRSSAVSDRLNPNTPAHILRHRESSIALALTLSLQNSSLHLHVLSMISFRSSSSNAPAPSG